MGGEFVWVDYFTAVEVVTAEFGFSRISGSTEDFVEVRLGKNF